MAHFTKSGVASAFVAENEEASLGIGAAFAELSAPNNVEDAPYIPLP